MAEDRNNERPRYTGAGESSLPKLKIFYVLEEMASRQEEFTEANYKWHRRLQDPNFDSILNQFTSYDEMHKAFNEYQLRKGQNEEEIQLVLSAQAETEDYARVNEINMKKISNLLLGKASPGGEQELEKIHNMLRNTSKSGNVFLNMMVYRQIERMANLVDSLDLAEQRMYSDEVMKTVKPDKLFAMIDQINKSMQTTLKFIDDISNRQYGDMKNTGNNITINQINVGTQSGEKPTDGTVALPKPTRDMLRRLTTQIRIQAEKDAQERKDENK